MANQQHGAVRGPGDSGGEFYRIAERHWPILAALESRKPDTAESIIRSHILELGERVIAGLDSTEESSLSG